MKTCELRTKRCREERQHTELSIVRKATINAKTALVKKLLSMTCIQGIRQYFLSFMLTRMEQLHGLILKLIIVKK
jgi:hypothetical protein